MSGSGLELYRLPMFPLGSVLFPELGLPLRIFEPRYRQMMAECLDGDRNFGVVLIERGSEVGGGEVRLRVATVAHILDVSMQDDGTVGVFTVGTGRVEVIEWLPDAPYPAAIVTPLVDADDLGPSFDEAVAKVTKRLRSALAHRAEANLPAAPATIELSPDPTIALWQVCALVPATAFDDYGLLSTRSVAERIDAIGELIDASADQVRFHLG
jgi:uncharacterized protein